MVTLIDESYQPPALDVAVGATVRWENIDGDDDHTVTSADGAFNSGVLPAGSAFEYTFDAPGTFPYFCAIHPSMTGTVVVREPALAGEPGDAAGSTTDAVAVVTDVSVVDVAFKPADIEVPAGSTVDWTNEDPFAHTVTARDGAFDSGNLDAGGTFSQTFPEPGTFEYFCAVHPSMTGTVTVTP